MESAPHAVPPFRVLLLDVDATHRLLAGRLWERLGAPVEAVTDAADAVAAAPQTRTVVLFDGALVGNGTALFRNSEAAIHVMMSAAEDAVETPVPAAVDLVLPKPLALPDLRLAARLATGAPRQPGPGIDGPLLDSRVLRRLAADLADDQAFTETVELYLEQLPARLAALRSNLTEGDAPALRAAAHSLKSASAMLGARALASGCLAVEQSAAAGSLPEETVGTVVVEAQHVAAVLPAYVQPA